VSPVEEHIKRRYLSAGDVTSFSFVDMSMFMVRVKASLRGQSVNVNTEILTPSKSETVRTNVFRIGHPVVFCCLLV